MKKVIFLILLVFLFSCIFNRMEKSEMSMNGSIVTDTIYEGEIESWPEAEYIEEEITHTASRDEEPEMSAPSEDLTINPQPVMSGNPPPPPPPEEWVTVMHSTENPITIDDFTQGDIMYLIQDSMVVGEISVVNMTISYGIDGTEVIAEIETFSDESVFTKEIRIAPVMKARLIDISGDNFKIIPVTPEEQFLEFNSYTRWVWNVTPLNEGNHQLALSVDVVLDDKGKTIEVYDDFIYVYSTQSTISKILGFIVDNWKWFVSSLFLPLFYFLFKQFRKKP